MMECFRARLEKEKKNELERNRRQTSPPRRQVRRSPIRTPGQNRDQRDRNHRSPPRNNARSPPKITQNPQSARSRLGERPRSPIKTGQARNRSPRRSPPRGGRPPEKRNRSPIRKRSPQDRKPRLDQPRSKPNDTRPSDNTAKGTGWGASPPKPTSDGWGSSGGWGNSSEPKNGGWGENVSWNANGDNKNTSWGSEPKSPKSWGDTTSNDRNVTYTNDRTMIVSKPVENSTGGWGMTRHDTGRKG